jgi:hypothetical protein
LIQNGAIVSVAKCYAMHLFPYLIVRPRLNFRWSGVISVLNKMRAAGIDDVWCTETRSTSDSRATLFWLLHPNQLNDRRAVDNYNFIANTNKLCVTKTLVLKILAKFFNTNSSPKPSLGGTNLYDKLMD